MKNARYVFGIMVIGFCLLSINPRILAADSPQLPWRTTVWPALSSTQWYWYEPETNLTTEQVEAVFKEVAAANIPFIDSRSPGINTTVNNIKLEVEKPKKGKRTDKGASKPEQVALMVDTHWVVKKPLPRNEGDSAYSLPLNTMKRIDLHYVLNANNPWSIGMLDVDLNYLYVFYFKDENFARRFANAVASSLAQKNISLRLPKLGFGYADLTPAQAEALGKTRIESVLVSFVAIDGPADKANIQPLDVITEFNGVKVRNFSHFSSLVEGIASGTKITFACLRRTEAAEKDQKQFDWKPIVIEMIAR